MATPWEEITDRIRADLDALADGEEPAHIEQFSVYSVKTKKEIWVGVFIVDQANFEYLKKALDDKYGGPSSSETHILED